MKVLMISKALGTSAYHCKLREMANLGLELSVVVPSRWGKQESEVVEPSGYELQVVDCRINGSNHFHFYPDIARIVASERWDLVHIDEEPFSFVTCHSMRACARNSGSPFLFFTWENIDRRYPPPFNLVKKRVLNGCVAGIAGNDEARSVLRAQGFTKPMAVIPQFGVDPDFFQKSDVSGLREKLRVADRFVIGFAGRIVESKGIADLLQAFAALPEQCVLVLVGEGAYETQAKHLAQKLGVASRTRWIPHVPSLEVPEYMNAFNVLVLPSRTTSRWKEQFGRVLIEAMACERPVVGSNSGEIPNVIGDAGLVFPEGDVAAFTRQLRRLYDDPGLADHLGKKGHYRVLANFTQRRIAEATVEFYRTVLGNHALSRADNDSLNAKGAHAVV